MTEVVDLTEAPAGFLWLILTQIKQFSRISMWGYEVFSDLIRSDCCDIFSNRSSC